MHTGKIALVLILCLGVAACDVVGQRYQLAAEPLMTVPDQWFPPETKKGPAAAQLAPSVALSAGVPLSPSTPISKGTANGLTPLEMVHLLVQDSEIKCAAFVNSMFAESAGSGVVLDVLNTASSAVATAVGASSVKDAFSASSTVFGGVKTSISANYLNSLGISHIAQAIQTTYSSNMQAYLKYLDSADPNKIDVFAERSTIVAYHSECSLAAAEGSISASLQTSAPLSGGAPLSPSAPLSAKPPAPILGAKIQ